jgi:hypothetical protein
MGGTGLELCPVMGLIINGVEITNSDIREKVT